MTSYYVYAIQPANIEVPRDLYGFHPDALAKLCWRDLAAVVAPHFETDTLAPTPGRVQRHHEVVKRLSELGPVLPVRFGTILADCGTLSEALKRHAETLHADLERLAGKYEYGITVLWGDYLAGSDGSAGEPIEPQGENGRAYMLQRLGEYQREQRIKEIAESIKSEVESSLEPVAEEIKLQAMMRDDVPLRGSFLVPAEWSDAFETEFERLHENYKPLRMLLTGPWPPYSFVSEDYTSLPAHKVR